MRIGARPSPCVGGRRGGRVISLLIATFLSAPLRAATAAPVESPETAVERVGDPAAPQALGRVFAAGPTARALVVASSGGYGYTESVLHAGDAHHRAAGSLAVEGRPTTWLGLGLRVDGRYDRHETGQPGSQGTDDGWVGDPRLLVRVDGALGRSFRAGGRLAIWFPGRNAPSIDLGATTPEIVGVLTWASQRSPAWLTANGGYRLNRSSRSASDAALLSPSDRVGLELSAFDQVLLGVAAAYGAGRTQAFAEASAELLVGAGSPSLSASPLRAGGGMRFALTAEVRLEAEVEADFGARPDLSASGPLMPIPPRAAVWLGVGYRFGGEARASAPRQPPRQELTPVVTAPPPRATIAGRVVAADGAAVSAARVTARAASAAEAAPVEIDEDARFTVSGPAGQAITIEASAEGYESTTETVTPPAGASAELTLTLRRRLPSGQIRGLVRSFRGTGLDAEIQIESGAQDLRTLRTQEGRFEVDVTPGSYEITIVAAGYESQQRRVEVEQNGVTLLNVDLRSAR
jgi:hypothetical protein